jgi:RNA binding exosome subunit
MKLVHNIRLSVFAYEGEDAQKIADTLTSICPFSIADEKLQLKATNADGFNEKKIRIFELVITKEKLTTKFLANLKSNLQAADIDLLIRQLDSRLDNELYFYIRLDKPTLLEQNRLAVTDSGNCFHIRMSMAAYPKNREVALDILTKWLS